jgi:hypothetical protein
LVLASLFVGGSAGAADAKSYSANHCVGEYWSTDVSRLSSGTVGNPHANQVTAICPVVTDNMGNTAGLTRARVYLSYYGSGTLPSCRFGVLAQSTDAWLDSELKAMPSTGDKMLEFTLDGPYYAETRYLLQCYLTPGATFSHYEVSEI